MKGQSKHLLEPIHKLSDSSKSLGRGKHNWRFSDGLLFLSIAACLIVTCVLSIRVAAAADNRLPNAKQSRPIGVVSFSGYDALFADIQTLGKASGNPDLAVGLEAMLKFATRSQGLAGLDKTRAWGGAVYPGDPRPLGFVFLPVNDLDKLLSALEPMIGKSQGVGDGVLKISGKQHSGNSNSVDGQSRSLYVKQFGAWVVISANKGSLSLTPRNPGELLGDLPQHYDLALRIAVDEIPDNFRDRLLSAVQEHLQEGIASRLGDAEGGHALAARVSRDIVEALRRESKEVDCIILGWKLDNQSEKILVDLIVQPRPGSNMQQRLSRWGEAKSGFAGFRMAEAFASCGWRGRLTAGEATAINKLLAFAHAKTVGKIAAMGLSDETQDAARRFADELLDFCQLGVDTKRFDAAVTLLLDNDSATLLAGQHVHDPARLEQLARQFAGLIAAERPRIGKLIRVQEDVERFKGVQLRRVSVSIPREMEDRHKIVALVGETLEVVLGVGAEGVYLAAGREPLRVLKKAIAASVELREEPVSPLQMSIGLRSLAGLIARMSEDEKQREKAAALAEILSRTADEDHLVFTAEAVDGGLRLRLEAQSGIVKAAGAIVPMLPANLMNK